MNKKCVELFSHRPTVAMVTKQDGRNNSLILQMLRTIPSYYYRTYNYNSSTILFRLLGITQLQRDILNLTENKIYLDFFQSDFFISNIIIFNQMLTDILL